MAVVLPMVLVLVIGCIDGGRAIAAYIAVSNATRAGADWAASHRFGAVNQATWEAHVRSDVAEEMAGTNGLDANQLAIGILTANGTDSSIWVTVTASYPFQPAIPWPGMPAQWTLEHSVTACQYR
jgi:Flp pilus assembly protein TadG